MKTFYIKTNSDVSDGLYVFSKVLNIAAPGDCTINLFSTGRYILKIDGAYICEGPCKSHQHVRYYDTVRHWLDFGPHLIEILVLHIGLSNEWRLTSVFKAAKPHVIFRAKCNAQEFHSDSTWKCTKKDGYRLKHHSWNIPGEDVDFNGNETELAITEGECFDFDLGTRTDTGVDRSLGLRPRPIPLLLPGKEIHLSVVKSGEGFMELDAGAYVTAKVALSLAENTCATVTYAECYEKDGCKGLRDDCSGQLQGWSETVRTSEKTVWEPFWFKAFRYIRIETEHTEDILAVCAWRWNYPMEQRGDFVCSNEHLNRMYQISANTLRCCSFETFVDCPFYEQEQYIMDSTIESATLMKYTGDTSLVRKCIEEFAASQTDEGILLSSYPDDYRQIIPGFGLFWVFLLYDYLEYSADFAFARRFSGTMDKLLWYFESRLSEDGLIEKGIWWDFVDWVPGWKQGEPVSEAGKPITIYNLYYASALKKAAEINARLGRIGLNAEYMQRYERTTTALKTHCLDSDGYFCDGKVGTGKSVHCAIWSVLAGIDNDGQKLLQTVGNDCFKQPSFCMSYYLFRALEVCGLSEEIFRNLTGWQRMLDLHCTTWCENPDNPRSECHGWSTAPLYECAANLLGVSTGFEDVIIIKPVTAGIDWVKGTVPTRYGNVAIYRNQEEIHIISPEGVKKHLILSDTTEHFFTEGTFAVKHNRT